jgi:hypothetical protein
MIPILPGAASIKPCRAATPNVDQEGYSLAYKAIGKGGFEGVELSPQPIKVNAIKPKIQNFFIFVLLEKLSFSATVAENSTQRAQANPGLPILHPAFSGHLAHTIEALWGC